MAKILLIMLVCIIGCGPSVHRGRVIDKDQRDGYMMTTFMYSGSTPIPILTWIPASYKLQLVSPGGDVAWMSVSKSTYESTTVGDKVRLR